MTGRRDRWQAVLSAAAVVAVLAVAAGCAPSDEAEASSPKPAASSSGSRSSASPLTLADPVRTPAELLRAAVDTAKAPSSMRVRGKVALRDATLLQFLGEVDPTEGPTSMFLDVFRRAGREPIRSRTLVAEGELFAPTRAPHPTGPALAAHPRRGVPLP